MHSPPEIWANPSQFICGEILTRSSKELSHELTSLKKQRIYMTPNIVLKTMKTVHFNLLILSEKLCGWRNHLSLCMGLNLTVHPLMNISTSCKVVFSLDQRFRERNFHHLEMNSYLHQKLFPWQVALFFIHWNIRIYVIMILYVSCQLVWYSITSSWI